MIKTAMGWLELPHWLIIGALLIARPDFRYKLSLSVSHAGALSPARPELVGDELADLMQQAGQRLFRR
ncbi:hypothetical protein ACE103_30125 [Bradyrhizobium sp. ma5]|uniref:hypothetical protein n=1 Tax=Bradyrhizobium sp. ma5 TaxID=3344828 RepID=UPI0035D4ED19